MGRLKDRLIQEEEQGWYFTGKHVCTECFTDDAIKQLVSARLEHNRCDYCKCSGEEPMAAPLDDVLKMIGEGLAVEWGDAINELPYESAEGGYQGQTYDTWEFFEEVIGFPTKNHALQRDIAHAFRDHVWCQRNYFSFGRQDALLVGWEEFCDDVNHQNRYFFFDPPRKSEPEPEPEAISDADLIDLRETPTPSEILQEIGDLVRDIGLVKVVKSGYKLWRARICAPDKTFKTAVELVQSPSKKLSSRIE